MLVPALFTLAVTILRLAGELQHWSEAWFNPTPGGGGALIGIVWLGPLFGIYFAWKLSSMGDPPDSPGRAIGFALLGIAAIAFGITLAAVLVGAPGSVGFILIVNAVGAIAGLIQLYGWPQLARVLLIYGFAARVPVAAVMFFAIMGNWGTHYDGPPPNFPAMGWVAEFLWTGLLPQLVFWVGFTVVTGSLFGGITAMIARRRRTELQSSQQAG